MVAHLARCQLDPAAPRSSIETLLHAFVPARHVHHTHPDAINVLAGTRDGERLVAECFGDRPPGSLTSGPGSTLAKQVGAEVRHTPGLRLVVLAKHGLVVWGDSAEEAYRRTIEVINEAAEFVNATTAGQPRFGGPLSRDGLGAATSCARCCPRCGARFRRSARRSWWSTPLPGRSRSSSPRTMPPSLVTVGAACPDHLVHTKRAPALGSVRSGTRRRGSALRASPRARGAVPGAYRAYVERHRDSGHRARRPGRARRADPARRAHRRRAVSEGSAAVTRPLPPSDRGHGRGARPRRLHFADRGRELRRRILAARALQALAATAARRTAGTGRARDRSRRRNRTRRRGRARAKGRVHRRFRPRWGGRRRRRGQPRRRGAAVAGDVTDE